MISCGEAAEFFRLSALRSEGLLIGVVEGVVRSASLKAKGFIGHSQAGWEPLSEATLEGFRHHSGRWIEGKRSLGYPDDPLLRTGQMRDSIEAEVDGLQGMVYSNDKRALWQELGTEGADYPIPPRPFLAKGLQETLPEAEIRLRDVMMELLVP